MTALAALDRSDEKASGVPDIFVLLYQTGSPPAVGRTGGSPTG
jgi:hypothetical protein